MGAETAIIIFGALLILLAILGGGFQAREVNIPTIGAKTRGVCALLGSLFVGVGVFLAPGSAKPPNTVKTPVAFRIHNELSEGQVSEQVRIMIDDRMIGTLTVSAIHPQAELLVSVPQEGRYSYQLSAVAVFVAQDGQTQEFNGTGAGYINATADADFELEGDISGDTWLAHLVLRK